MFWVEAGRGLLRHRLRSTLTTLGIAIGIAAVVLVVAIGQAGKERAENTLQDLGDNLVWIEAGSRNVAGVRTGTHGTTSLTIDDAEASGAKCRSFEDSHLRLTALFRRSTEAEIGPRASGANRRSILPSRGGRSFEEPLSAMRMLTKRRARSCWARRYASSCSGPRILLDERFGRPGNCSKSSGFSAPRGRAGTEGIRTTGFCSPTRPPTPSCEVMAPCGSTTSSAPPRHART